MARLCARYHMAERISTLIVAICLCEAWCWANAFPTMVGSPVRVNGDGPMQLSPLALHYERSTSIFKGGTGDTLPAREQSLSRAVQEGASASSAGRPHTDTIVAQHVAMASARLQLQSGRPTGSATLWHSSAIGLGRTAHRNERRRQFGETGKKSIPRGITEVLLVLPVLLLLFRLMPSSGNAASRCCHGKPTAAFILLQVLLVGLQVPGSQAAAAGADVSAVDTDWSLATELLSSKPLALGALTVLVSLYCIYSMIATRHYPPRMHVLWPALRGKFKLKEYGPVECLRQAQRKHGEIFRICLPGQSCTFLIGREACECWFKQQNDTLNPAAAYRSFMKPVFGPRVVYDAEEGKMSSQLRFVKHGLGIEMMRQHPAKLVREVRDYCVAEQSGWIDRGEVELYQMTSEMIINTASRCILGDEIRDTVHREFSQYYSDLEKGISHLSFFASWLPTPAHRRRDIARRKLSEIFTPIIRARRDSSAGLKDGEKKTDFLQVLIDGEYRDGTKPDDEAVVGLLVAALFGGQHTSNITSTWVLMMIHSPKNRTTLLPRLLKEQEEVLSRHHGEITFDALQEMDLLENCIKETLRMFPPLIVSLGRRRSLARHVA